MSEGVGDCEFRMAYATLETDLHCRLFQKKNFQTFLNPFHQKVDPSKCILDVTKHIFSSQTHFPVSKKADQKNCENW